jgi:hypothetical protein
MKPLQRLSTASLVIAAISLSACVPTTWSSAKSAAAVDACQRARSIDARIPYTFTETSSLDRATIHYILDSLDYLMRDTSLGIYLPPPLRPFPAIEIPQPSGAPPTPEALLEREDAIRVSVIRSGNRRLKKANEASTAQLVAECRNLGFLD